MEKYFLTANNYIGVFTSGEILIFFFVFMVKLTTTDKQAAPIKNKNAALYEPLNKLIIIPITTGEIKPADCPNKLIIPEAEPTIFPESIFIGKAIVVARTNDLKKYTRAWKAINDATVVAVYIK